MQLGSLQPLSLSSCDTAAFFIFDGRRYQNQYIVVIIHTNKQTSTAWTSISPSIAAILHHEDLLVNQPVQQVGFRSNRTIPKSVTREITMEIESARSTCLGKMIDNDNYERWSWEGWSKI